MDRRHFLSGLFAAPAIVVYDHIMPVRLVVWPASPILPALPSFLLELGMITREVALAGLARRNHWNIE